MSKGNQRIFTFSCTRMPRDVTILNVTLFNSSLRSSESWGNWSETQAVKQRHHWIVDGSYAEKIPPSLQCAATSHKRVSQSQLNSHQEILFARTHHSKTGSKLRSQQWLVLIAVETHSWTGRDIRSHSSGLHCSFFFSSSLHTPVCGKPIIIMLWSWTAARQNCKNCPWYASLFREQSVTLRDMGAVYEQTIEESKMQRAFYNYSHFNDIIYIWYLLLLLYNTLT